MADAEETPAQRQARIRREKREAKIKSGGQGRLDKITQLSGRTPESMRNFDSPIQTPPRSESPAVMLPIPADEATTDPDIMKQQEDFMRAMLRNQASMPSQNAGQNGIEEDPMMKMLSQMLGGLSDGSTAQGEGMPSLNPDDIAKATGLPPFVTNMMMGSSQAPITPAQSKSAQIWKVIRTVAVIIGGTYMLFTVNKLTGTFGEDPPAPATFQNPFVIFTTFEFLLHSVRFITSDFPLGKGPKFWWQTAKEVGQDGAVMVFLMGVYSWWHGLV